MCGKLVLIFILDVKDLLSFKYIYILSERGTPSLSSERDDKEPWLKLPALQERNPQLPAVSRGEHLKVLWIRFTELRPNR